MLGWVDMQVELQTARGVARLQSSELQLTPGLAMYRVSIPVSHQATWLGETERDAFAPALLTGTVRSSSRGLHLVGSVQPRFLDLRGFPCRNDLTLDLTHDQLAALNRSRDGGDLTLTIDLSVTLLNVPADMFPSASGQGTLRIRSAIWLQLLDDNRIETTVAVRVPLSITAGDQPIPVHPSHTRIVMLLREARSEFREGRYRPAVITCRRALESLEQLVEIPSRSELVKTNPRERDTNQRWAALHNELKGLLDPAAHEDANAQSFDWTQLDVESVLAAVAAVVARTIGTRTPDS